MVRVAIFIAIIACTLSAFAGPAAPVGWRLPVKSDLRKEWLEYRDSLPIPYHARGDLNGDGLIDEVWILLPVEGEGFGLFVFFATKRGKEFRIIEVESVRGSSPAQGYAVVARPPGKYLTWCAQSTECDKDEPKSVTIRNVGFEFYTLGQASGLYYWNSRKQLFESVTTSD